MHIAVLPLLTGLLAGIFSAAVVVFFAIPARVLNGLTEKLLQDTQRIFFEEGLELGESRSEEMADEAYESGYAVGYEEGTLFGNKVSPVPQQDSDEAREARALEQLRAGMSGGKGGPLTFTGIEAHNADLNRARGKRQDPDADLEDARMELASAKECLS